MGHDFECSEDGENIYVSYNHCWAFYEFLDEERGFRAIYDYEAHELLPKYEKYDFYSNTHETRGYNFFRLDKYFSKSLC